MKTIGNHNYYVYILTNINKTVIYTGVTNDLTRRIYEHKNANNFSFTKKYKVYFLIYYEWFQDINEAIKREKQIKGWTRAKKNNLIDDFNPNWLFLNNEFE